jgi:integrase/recombinase XerC/integrase/recombinase XerD
MAVGIGSPCISSDLSALELRNHMNSFIAQADIGGETKRVYGNALSHFIQWADDMPVTTAIIKTYKTYLLNIGLTPNTVSVYLAALKQFFSHLVEKGVFMFNTAKEVKRPRIPRSHQRDALTAEAARHLLDSIPKDSIKGNRDYAMVNLMARTGIREIEVSRALIGDIVDKEGERILKIHGKGRDSKDSFVVLTDEAYDPIAKFLSMLNDPSDSSALFPSVGNRSKGSLSTRAIRKIISDYMKKAGLKSKRITPHSLRHTAITLAIEGGNGQNLIQVQQMARHANISTTLGYFHEFQRLKNAAERCIKI